MMYRRCVLDIITMHVSHPQLHSSLQQRAQKRSSLILKMDRISPKLQSLKSTVIAMPGLGMSGKVKLYYKPPQTFDKNHMIHVYGMIVYHSFFFLQVVTIESVSNTVQILPTKTKPKKLILLGSDGKRLVQLTR